MRRRLLQRENYHKMNGCHLICSIYLFRGVCWLRMRGEDLAGYLRLMVNNSVKRDLSLPEDTRLTNGVEVPDETDNHNISTLYGKCHLLLHHPVFKM